MPAVIAFGIGVSLYQLAGISLSAFGVSMVAMSVGMALAFDTLMIDLVALVLLVLGLHVYSGSRRAVYWCTWVMAMYMLSALVLIAGLAVSPSSIRFAGRPIESINVWHFIFVSGIATWAMINFVLLTYLRRLTTIPSPNLPQSR